MNNKTESAERWKDNSVYKEVLATASGAAKGSLTLTERLRALSRAEHDDLSVGPACLSGECPEGKLSCGKPWK